MQSKDKIAWTPEATPTFWVNQASRLILRRFEERLRPYDFGVAYLPVVFALEENGPLLQKDLVERAGVEQPTMTALLARMQRDGIVLRAADAADGRAQRISLTKKGRSRLNDVKTAMIEVVDQALNGVSQVERNSLIKTLQAVMKNLS